MTEQELLKKLHIDSLPEESQQQYLAQLIMTAAKRAGITLAQDFTTDQQQQVERILKSDAADVDDQMAQVVGDQVRQKAFMTALDQLIEEISSGVEDSLNRLKAKDNK